MNKKFLISLILIFFISISTYAQNNDVVLYSGNAVNTTVATKIAFIDTRILEDEKRGIERFILESKKMKDRFNKAFNEEFPPKKKPSQEEIKNWIYKIYSHRLDEHRDYLRLKKLILDEINFYAIQIGFDIVFVSGKKLPSQISLLLPQDITDEFIAYFNKKYP